MKRTIILTMVLTFLWLFAESATQAETIIGCDTAPCMAKERKEKAIDIVIPCAAGAECDTAPLKTDETPQPQQETTQKRKWIRPSYRINNIPETPGHGVISQEKTHSYP